MSVWEERLKPRLDFIYEQLVAGRTNKEVFTAIGVSATSWYDNQKNNPEFAELVHKAREEYTNTLVSTRTAILEARPPEEKMLKELEDKFFDSETPANEKINIYKLLYPEADWYRGMRIYDAETRRRSGDKDRFNIEQKTVIGEDVMEMLRVAVDPEEFKE